MGLWTYLCYLISVVLVCGLCFGFWFLCVFFGLISLVYGLVMISLFFGWFLMGLGWFWFLCSLVDFSWIWVLISQLFESGFFNFSILYVGHLSAIILHDQSRFNISYFSSFEDIFFQWDPKYYVYLLMPNKVSLASIPVNWLKNFEGQLHQYPFFFFF